MKIVQSSRQFLILLAWLFLTAYVGHVDWIGESHAQTPLTVVKKAVNPGTGATLGSTNGGDTIRYLIEYGINPSVATPSLANVSAIDKMSTDLKAVAGTAQYPTAWADGGTGLSFANPLLFPGVDSVLSPSAAPLPTIDASASGGDGWIPIIYHGVGKSRFFEIYHHDYPAKINCQDFATGAQCAGYPKDLLMDAGGAPKLNTQVNVQTVQIGQKLYFAATEIKNEDDRGIGIGCWDMQKDESCKYKELRSAGLDYKNVSSGRYAGVVMASSRPNDLFAHWNGILYCYNVVTNTECSGYPKTVLSSSTKTQYAIMVLDQYLFVQANGYITCLNTTTNAGCGGSWPAWPSGISVPNTVLIGMGIYANQAAHLHPILKSNNGNADGVCSTLGGSERGGWEGPTFFVRCWDLRGNSVIPPSILSNDLVAGHVPSAFVLPGTKKVYYPIVPARLDRDVQKFENHLGATRCWDYGTGAACAGFTDGGPGAITGERRWDQPNQSGAGGIIGTTLDYGYAYDATSGCMFGLGDAAKLWSFDPGTGNAPCGGGGSTATVYVPDPKPFCDGSSSSRGVSWDTVELINTPQEVASVTLTVYDGKFCNSANMSACTASTAIKTVTSSTPNTSLWSIPLGGITYSTYPNIVVQVSLTYKVAPPATFPNFSMRTLYSTSDIRSSGRGPFGQICLNATVASCPSASKITNVGEIWGGSGLLGQGISDLTVPADTRIFSDSAIAVNNTKLSSTTGTDFAFQATYQRTNWSGDLTRYPFDAAGDINEAASPPLKWTASSNLPSPANRKIYTSSALGAGQGMDFVDTMTASLPANFGVALQDKKDVVNYLRGDRSLEINGSNIAGQKFRYRNSALGDIIRSNPLYYKGNVYVQANDGMLHAFDANTGVEVFAYIPNAVLPQLTALSSPTYSHQYLMDGQMAVDSGAASPLLVASAGGVAPALFGLDIGTLPGNAASIVKWESTSSYLGQANGAVHIAKLADGTRIGIVSNGMGSTNKTASLLLVNLSNGAIIPIDTGVGSGATPNGLSAAALLTDAKGVLQFVYAGDMLGNVWRFTISSATSGSVMKLFSGVSTKPISAAPAISRQYLLGNARGYMVYFGTGKPIDRADQTINPADANIQSMYGILDKIGNTTTIYRTDLVAQTYGESSVTLDGALQTIRVMSTNPVDYKVKKGWYIDLLTVDERVIAAPQFRDERVAFVTTVPYKKAGTCFNDALTSFFMEVDATTGGQTAAQVFQFNDPIPAATPIFNGLKIGGTVAGIPSAVGTMIRSNLVSSAEKTGLRSTQVVKTKLPNGALKRQSWQQLF